MNNVYDTPEYADIVTKLKYDLDSIRKYYKDSEELDKKFIELYESKK